MIIRLFIMFAQIKSLLEVLVISVGPTKSSRELNYVERITSSHLMTATSYVARIYGVKKGIDS